MDEIAVSIKNVSKSYLLYKRPQDRLKQSLFRYFGKDYARFFWALHDVSCDIRRGEVLGIIGRNGSGKSTLLQIVAGTLQSTTGEVTVRGRLSAMLELGAGFSPEYTGRENIYLNGAILGMDEDEMRRREKEIIAFANIGEFIDQPVKLYSSGMFIRLGFAIASCVSPDVLLIDEALAVGDAGFVIKCMNRMKQLKDRGTTIILVTHDVQTVRSFCDTVMWIKDGYLEALGPPMDVTSKYIQSIFEGQELLVSKAFSGLDTQTVKSVRASDAELVSLDDRADLDRWGSGEIRLEAFAVNAGYAAKESVFEYGQYLRIVVVARAERDVSSTTLGIGIALRNTKGLDIITSTTYEQDKRVPPLKAGQRVRATFEFENILAPGDYALVINFEDRKGATPHYYDFIENALIFKTVSKTPIFSQVLPKVTQHIEVE